MSKHKTIKQHYTDLANNKTIAKFAKIFRAKNLWIFNRHSVVWGITLGIMCSWIPMPFHTWIAVAFALVIDCNIPLVVISIWFANPITMPFMYYVAFRVGEALMHLHPSNMAFHPSIKDLMAVFDQIWQPLLLGCLICSIFCGMASYLICNFLWFKTPTLRAKLASKIQG